MRLIDADDFAVKLKEQHDYLMQDPEVSKAMKWREAVVYNRTLAVLNEMQTVDAVVLPYQPRPLLKDRNPFNMDVYCPECGTNLSGYYGEDSLPIVTCFNCGEILDAHKTTTKTDGERRSK